MSDASEPIEIPNTFYCPQAAHTLILLSEVIESGGRWETKGNAIVLHFPCGKSVTAKYANRRWTLDEMNTRHVSTPIGVFKTTVPPASDVSEALKWHCRFGHTSMRGIQRLLKHSMATGLPTTIAKTPFTCLDCLKSKSLRSVVLGPSGDSPGPLELIVSDVAGPFPPSVQGVKYMATFRDVATTYTEIVCVANRDAVPRHFIDFIERLERQTGLTVKRIRSDGAGEYIGQNLSRWCLDRGIIQETTNAYEHHQNGVAEWVNWTIDDMG